MLASVVVGQARAEESDEAEASHFFGRLAAGGGFIAMSRAEAGSGLSSGARPMIRGVAATHATPSLAVGLRSEVGVVPSLSRPLIAGGSTHTVSFAAEALADYYLGAARTWHAQLGVGYEAYLAGFADAEFPLGPIVTLGAGVDFLEMGTFAMGAIVDVRGTIVTRSDADARFGVVPMLSLAFTDH